MEALASQLGRLRHKIEEVEEGIFEVARLYSTLPLDLRKDVSRLKIADPELLEACFFDALEVEQEEFWGRVVGQAKWVVLWIERGRSWAEGFGALMEFHVASMAVDVARGALMDLEIKAKKMRYELLGFSKEERGLFKEQSQDDETECIDGAIRFLYFWPGTEGWLQRGFSGKDEEEVMERDFPREAVEFLGLMDGGLNHAEAWLDEDVGAASEWGRGVDIKMEFSDEEGDSGVFLEGGRKSGDSRATPDGV